MRRGTELALLAVLLVSGCTEPAVPVAPPPPPPVKPPPMAAVAPAPPDAGPAPVVAADGANAFVLSIGGEVLIRRQGSEDWISLKVGDAVRVGDQLRTSSDGQLGLSLDAAQIRLHEDSEVTFDAIDPNAVRISVTGTTEAEPKGDGKVALVAGGAVATSGKGKLTVTYDGKDVIAGALMGDATLTRGDETVKLKGGEFAVARAQGKPKPAKIPKAISLDVAWPEQTETNQTELKLRARASAYARVFVGGKKAEPLASGDFEGKVTLKRGKQNVVVFAVDPFGRRAVRSRQFVMDPDAPSIKGAVEYR